MSQQHFLVSFDEKTTKKLYLADFWTTEPCDWTVMNYVSKLVVQDPTATKRVAFNRLTHDAKVVKRHVIAGTVAETMVNIMASFPQNSKRKELFNTFFDNYAKYGVQKTRLRSAMAEQVANEEVEKNTRKRPADSNDSGEGSSSSIRAGKKKAITTINDDSKDRNDDDDSSNGDNDYESDDIWKEWAQFLNDKENIKFFTQLSPEKHSVIWCGKQVRRRSCLPVDLYAKLNEQITSIPVQDISPCLSDMSMNIFDAESKADMKTCTELLDHAVPDDENAIAEKKLVVDICAIFNDHIYDDSDVSSTCTPQSS